MTLLPASPRVCRALCTGIVLLALACGESDSGLLMEGKMPLGQLWDGPEQSLYSQGNEEIIIRDFFAGRTSGFFVDVGSASPIKGSTTYYLEKHLGWTGIAIDALSEYGPDYAKKRPNTTFVSFIVTDESGTKQKFYRVLGAPGLSSTDGEREYDGKKLHTNERDVPTITLDKLMVQHGVERIDFLSMDIEGAEPKALAGFDIERYRPQLVCVESGGDMTVIEAYFAEHGYVKIEKYLEYDFVNWYYTPVKDNGGSGGA